jgi:hypothetical protein
MAIDLATVGVKFEAKGVAQTKGAFTEIGKEAGKVRRNLLDLVNPATAVKSVLGGIAGGLTGAAIGSFLKGAIDEARDAEDKVTQLKVAVENAGESFEKTQPFIDDAAGSIQRLTRYSDDAARGALTTLITTSGNVGGSLKNLSLVADLAAAKHLDLDQAAEIVGKAMAGNTTAIGKMFGKMKEGSNVLDVVRAKVRGFAEQDANTLTGRLDQVSNAWNDVKESIGNVVLGMGDVPGQTNAIRDALIDLKSWIDDNAASWRSWVGDFVDGARSTGSWLDKINEKLTKAGLTAHAMLTGNFKPLIEYLNTHDLAVRGGGSSWGDEPPKPKGAPPRDTGNTGSAKDKAVATPRGPGSFDSVSQARIDEIGKSPIMIGGINANPDSQNSIPIPGIGMSIDDLNGIFDKYHEVREQRRDDALRKEQEEAQKTADAMRTVQDTITHGMAQTLGDSIYNAFEAAFDGKGVGGVLKAFGKTVLAGVGQIFTQLGMVYLEYGGIMQALSTLLPNPFTAGPAGLAIGAALIAMGGALGAVANNGSGRGHAHSAIHSSAAGEQQFRLKFIDRDGRAVDAQRPVQVNATIIGPNDPRAQRDITQLIENAARRKA